MGRLDASPANPRTVTPPPCKKKKKEKKKLLQAGVEDAQEGMQGREETVGPAPGRALRSTL